MWRKTWVFMSLIAALSSEVGAVEVEAPISAVVVYPGSATIERTVRVPAGSNLLEIRGLSNNFDTKTLFMQVDRGVRVGQLVVQDATQKDGLPPREKELLEKSRQLQDQIDALDIEVKSAAIVTAYLDRLGTPGDDRRAPDGRAISGLAEGIGVSAARALHKAQQAEVKKRGFKDELARLEKELAKVRSGANAVRSLVLRTAAEQGGQIRFSYQVGRAGWQPVYRAALDSQAASVELERLALVSQKTGEDWNGVKLKLSTGQPQAYREPVDPLPRGLVYRKEISHAMGMGAMSRSAAPMMAGPVVRSEAKALEDEAYVAPVIQTEGSFATEFEVPAKLSVPADGREVSVLLDKRTLAATQRVQVAPGIDRKGVLVAEVERPSGVWLPGNIQLYRDGNYVGATRWRNDMAEKFSFGFGQDDLLRVGVDRKGQRSGNVGFIGQRAQRKVSDTYTLTNQHRVAIELLVLESSPVSESEEVAVEREFVPPPSEENWKDRPGVMAWSKKLAPNESWQIDVGYTISYPKEGSVSNLP